MLHAVIMAGGSGSRLWPASRNERPKQFLALADERPLILSTVERLYGLVDPERMLIVTGEAMAPMARQTLPHLPREAILAEPAARNTAPCIGLAALRLLHDDPEAVMVVLPADHVIEPEPSFRDALGQAVALVEEDARRLVTLGIWPTYPSTSYGYIEREEPLSTPAAQRAQLKSYRVAQFHEKPPREKAEAMLRSKRFSWNAGIFVWKASTILEAIAEYEPELGEHLEAIARAQGQPDFAEVLREHFLAMKSISIDYAVMERWPSIVLIDAPFQWDDLGTWRSVERLHAGEEDASGNLLLSEKVLAIDASGNVVRSEDPEHLLAILGVENLIVIHTPEATLIAHRDAEESVREVMTQLKARGWERYL
jgi:mannose-1-phosphate guanylyltransferase